MSNVQIPNLPAAVSIGGTEQLEAVQGGTSVRITTNQIVDLAISTTALYPIYQGVTPTQNFQNNRILTSDANQVVEAGSAIADFLTLGTQQSLQGSLTLANTAAGSYSVTLQSSNSSTSSATYTFPVAPAAGNGYVLTSTTGGVMSWTSPTGLGIDIDVNSTSITGGTIGRIVYDNAGTFGEISAITTNGSNQLIVGAQSSSQGDLVLSNTAVGAFPTHIKASNSASVEWTLTLPTTAGTNGYILTTNGSGVSAWTNPTALGIDIDVNSTAITGGTSGRLVYDNAGTFGEISAITTNGSAALTLGLQQTTQGSLILGNTAAGAFSTTIQSSNSASAAWTLTLPTTGGTNNYVLMTNGSGVSSWSQVSLTAGVTGVLPVANGGTGQSTNTIHGVLIGNAGNAINATTAGSAGQVLQSGGASADPTWSTATFPSTATGTGSILRADGTNWAATTATYPTTTTAGTILVSATANAVTASSDPVLGVQQTTQGSLVLANTAAGAFSTTIKSSNTATEAWTLTLPISKGSNGYILTTDGTGVSSWTNPTALGIDIDVNSTSITGGTSGRLVYDNAGTFGEISAITTNGSGTLTVGSQQTTQGSIVLGNTAAGAFATTVQSSNSASAAWTLTLPITAGTNNYVLTTNGSGVSSWSQVSLTAGVTGTLPVTNGGTGQSTNTIHGVLIGNAANAINATSAGSSGQVLQSGGASADPTWTTATFPSTAIGTGTILRADGTNWAATTTTYPATTSAGTVLVSASANTITGTSDLTLGVQQTTQGSIVLANTAAGAFSATLKSSNSTSAAWTLTLPTTAGTNNYVLTTDGSGTSSWSQVSLTAGVTGTLPVGNGGTGTATAFTAGSIIFAGASGVYSQNNGSFFWDNSNVRLGIGTSTPAELLDLAYGGRLYIQSTRADATSSSAAISMRKARGSLASPTIVSSGDGIGFFQFFGYDGAAYQQGAGVTIAVDSAPAAGSMPGRITFSTSASGSTTPTERLRIDSNGNVGIGVTPAAQWSFIVAKNITGSTTAMGIRSVGTIQSDVTNAARAFDTGVNTAAASFTLGTLVHYYANQGTFGLGSTVTNQYGFLAESTLVGAGTSNYGFYGNIASGSGRWNFYAAGTANNAYAGNSRFGGVTAPVATVDVTGSVAATTTILSSGATSGIGYATGAGGAVTQGTSRTTGVTLNNVSGAITLFSAAGSATYQTFTVTNSAVAATDVIHVCQKSGTDKYIILVTAVGAGSFAITFATTGGTTTEQPVFNFAVIKAVAA